MHHVDPPPNRVRAERPPNGPLLRAASPPRGTRLLLRFAGLGALGAILASASFVLAASSSYAEGEGLSIQTPGVQAPGEETTPEGTVAGEVVAAPVVPLGEFGEAVTPSAEADRVLLARATGLPQAFGAQSAEGDADADAGACAVASATLAEKTVTGAEGSVLYDYGLDQFRWHAGIGDYRLELELAPEVASGDRVRIDFEDVYAARPQLLEIDGVQVARSVDDGVVYGPNRRASAWSEYEFLPAVDGLVDRKVSLSSFYEFYGLGDPPATGEHLAGRVSTCAPVSNGDLGLALDGLAPMGITSSYASTPGATMHWQLAHRAEQAVAPPGGRRIDVVLSNPNEYQLRPDSLRAVAYAVNQDRTRPIIGTEQRFDVGRGLAVTPLPDGDLRIGFVAPKIREHQRFVVHVTGGSGLPGQQLDPDNRQISGGFSVDGEDPVVITPDASYGDVDGEAMAVGPPLIEKTRSEDGGYRLRITNPSSGERGYLVRSGTMVDRFLVNGETGESPLQLDITNPSRGTVEGNTWSYPALRPGETITASVPFDYAAWLQAGMPRIVSSVNTFGLPEMGECVVGEVLVSERDECSKVEDEAPEGEPPALQIDKAQLGEPVVSKDGASATVHYRIAVRNAGAITARAEQVIVRDVLPEGARDVRVAGEPEIVAAGLPGTGPAAVAVGSPAGAFDPATGIWEGFELNGGGAVAQLEITAALPMPEQRGAAREHVNRALVDAVGLPPRGEDPPCRPNDDLDGDDDRCDEVTTRLVQEDDGEPPTPEEPSAPEEPPADPDPDPRADGDRPEPPRPGAKGAPRPSTLAVTGGGPQFASAAALGGALLLGGTLLVLKRRSRPAEPRGGAS